MEARYVRAMRGLQWIVDGFYFFREAPLNLILLCFTYLLIGATLGLVPLLGGFIGTLTLPVFIAGIMVALRQLELNNKLELEYIFIGFKQNTVALITVGGIYLIGDVLIIGIFMLLGGDALVDMWVHGKRFQENELAAIMDDALSAILFSLLLAIPLMMAVWFAPMLVMFEKVPPVLAMRISFFACLKNLFAFQIYFIALGILAVLAAIPYGLGFIIWFPITFASVYISYKDIFHYENDESDPGSKSETTSAQNEGNENN
ncbi:MAG: BPSS1780 family membrane protein [Nitrosomonas sp.]|nr:BPSS1780 family membrane protein [Nitrosomonas sp.]